MFVITMATWSQGTNTAAPRRSISPGPVSLADSARTPLAAGTHGAPGAQVALGTSSRQRLSRRLCPTHKSCHGQMSPCSPPLAPSP